MVIFHSYVSLPEGSQHIEIAMDSGGVKHSWLGTWYSSYISHAMSYPSWHIHQVGNDPVHPTGWKKMVSHSLDGEC